jgi:8-oxo-dGTP pyrophosphatase MutT (NUDIX family)
VFTPGAYAIIVDAEQRVLLYQRNDMDHWNLLDGGVENGETPLGGCVARKCKEPLGV